jgi:hypothetical protein
MDDPIKFWVIAVGCNSPWAIFPPILFVYSFRAIAKQFASTTTAKKD